MIFPALFIAVLIFSIILIHRDQQRANKRYQEALHQHIDRLKKITNGL